MTRTRVALTAALLVIGLAAVAGFLVLRGDPEPPPVASARLVPADALAYVSVSTDRDREPVREAEDLLERFRGVRDARDALLDQLAAIGPGVSYRRDVRPWLGAEAALALLDTPGATATPLVVAAVAHRPRLEAFLARSAAPPVVASHRGVPISTYGAVSTALVGGYLVAGPAEGVRAAIDASRRVRPSLARSGDFRRAILALPPGRVASAYLPAEGVARLLAAQASALGAVGALLQSPRLVASAVSLSPADDGVALRVHSALAPPDSHRPAGPPSFQPQLDAAVPGNALAYLGLAGLDRRAGRLLGALAGRFAPGVASVLSQVVAQARRSGRDVRRALAPVLRGEVALWLGADGPQPSLTLIARADDEAAMRRALAQLEAALVRVLTPPPGRPGTGPQVRRRRVDGVSLSVIALGPGAELAYAVVDRRLVVSTSAAAAATVRGGERRLVDSSEYRATLGDRDRRVTSLVFLDLRQLLTLAERSGLSRNPAYLAIRTDLRRVTAVGAATRSAPRRSTTDLILKIR